MIIKWRVSAKINHDPQNTQSVEVTAGSKRKAMIMARNKLILKLKTEDVEVVNCTKILD